MKIVLDVSFLTYRGKS